MKKLKGLLLSAILGLSTISQAEIADIISITNINDKTFSVVCKNGKVESLNSEDILANNLCKKDTNWSLALQTQMELKSLTCRQISHGSVCDEQSRYTVKDTTTNPLKIGVTGKSIAITVEGITIYTTLTADHQFSGSNDSQGNDDRSIWGKTATVVGYIDAQTQIIHVTQVTYRSYSGSSIYGYVINQKSLTEQVALPF